MPDGSDFATVPVTFMRIVLPDFPGLVKLRMISRFTCKFCGRGSSVWKITSLAEILAVLRKKLRASLSDINSILAGTSISYLSNSMVKYAPVVSEESNYFAMRASRMPMTCAYQKGKQETCHQYGKIIANNFVYISPDTHKTWKRKSIF
jgi:hypothetical protein